MAGALFFFFFCWEEVEGRGRGWGGRRDRGGAGEGKSAFNCERVEAGEIDVLFVQVCFSKKKTYRFWALSRSHVAIVILINYDVVTLGSFGGFSSSFVKQFLKVQTFLPFST